MQLSIWSLNLNARVKLAAELSQSLPQGWECRLGDLSFSPVILIGVDSQTTCQELQWTEALPRLKHLFCLVVPAGIRLQDELVQAFHEGKFEDWVELPFRASEMIARFKLYQEILSLRSSLQQHYKEWKQNLRSLEKLHELHQPSRFPQVNSLKVVARYQVGESGKSNYFDVIQPTLEGEVYLLFFHFSSYRLSSLSLEALGSLPLQSSPVTYVNAFSKSLEPHFKKGDELSFFYGVYHSKEQTLQYLHQGQGALLVQTPKGEIAVIEHTGLPFSHPMGSGSSDAAELISHTLPLPPFTRFALLSQGVLREMGGIDLIKELFLKHQKKSIARVASEINDRLHSLREEAQAFPKEDCSIVLFETKDELSLQKRPSVRLVNS